MTIDSILTTSDSAYSKVDLNSETLEKSEEDIAGPFDLGVSITETLEDDKQTQIIYYSTANLMDSQINSAVAGGNEQLIMESLNWMCSSDEAETVSIPSKSLQVTALTPTAYDVSFWKICTMGLIPGVFLVIGFCGLVRYDSGIDFPVLQGGHSGSGFHFQHTDVKIRMLFR